ncbi:MAG: glycosyltransferase [Candidatus Omnitrophica bacterium]|nr:glycosyltransferase [Candidatus Omnitrophota bacterium]
MTNLKVLHCPTDTGGNSWGLSRAERKLGAASDVMVFRSSVYGYPADMDFKFRKVVTPRREWKRWRFLGEAMKKYDVFHFNFAKSLIDYPYLMLHHLELPLLKKNKKKIFFTVQGCDTRLRTYCLGHFTVSACKDCKGLNCLPSFVKRQRIKKIGAYADKIYALNPDLIYNCPGAEFLPYASVDMDEWTPSIRRPGGKRIFTILHAPTNRDIKGTRYLLGAVNRLQKEGCPVRLLLVEKTNRRMLREIYRKKSIDVVVDQLLVGWYGAFGVEAMACGVPVIAYIRTQDLQFIPRGMREELPVINATPSTIYDTIKELAENRRITPALSEKCRAYVEQWHDPLKIAKKVIADYEGK